ncbi:hypothetical protein C2E25_14970 [Geothermobacter hydrogeniphilus]|uniref:Uncharacterized protein n=1 Tax=Geothermobacter hydrogeniphilus TaxID=1969733 RepID=A0A2K2H6J7_9BACT|nr:hypothetical protein [Geothermobacter hydrogeniphilus]PNU18928.1 hypothetical protein C2E25_14970 [Geothermobacter hydrogeniphilus]
MMRLLLMVVFFSFCLPTLPAWSGEPINLKPGPDGELSELGVAITALRLTAEGHMIDFRFRVLDAEKAKPLFTKKNKFYLVDDKTGKALKVPVPAKLGPMRPSTKNPPQVGVVYWIFFGNTGLIRSGSRVTVALGDYRVQGLTIE